MEDTSELLHAFTKKTEVLNLSLRQAAELIGVSAATLSRFTRQIGEPDPKTARRLANWLYDKEYVEPKPIVSRRFSIGDVTFLVTITTIDTD